MKDAGENHYVPIQVAILPSGEVAVLLPLAEHAKLDVGPLFVVVFVTREAYVGPIRWQI